MLWHVIFLALPLLASSYSYKTEYIDVPVDHFSFTSNATFKLRYFVNNTYWLPSIGPIFFYTGNEAPLETFVDNTGFIFETAPHFNALIIFCEHRFYGESKPFGNASIRSPEHLGYLSTSQALQDFVYLIDYLRTTYTRNGTSPNWSKLRPPVVAIGGSYGGMLAAWLRMRYPASVVGSIAASAPIWQFVTPCNTFYNIVTDVYRYASRVDDCSRVIKEAWPKIRKIASNETGLKILSEKFKLCYALETNDGVNTLVGWLSEILVNIVMANYPYPTDFLAPLPENPVKHFCARLLEPAAATHTNRNSTPDALDQLVYAFEIYTNLTGLTKCNDLNTSSATVDTKTWDFQACTEIIMPICTTDTDMFENAPWNFTEYAAECAQRWNVSSRREDIAVLEYGGRDIRAASNIVFSNGLLDPWSSGGVLSNLSDSLHAFVIPDGAHHLDLRARNDADPVSVLEARKFHEWAMRKWIDDYWLMEYKRSRVTFSDNENTIIEAYD